MKLHIDFDSYFVNAERINSPELRGAPCVIYAGSDEEFFSEDARYIDNKIAFLSSIEVRRSKPQKADYKHFTAIAVSYEAKRFGIRVGDKLDAAFAKCPELKIARSNLSFYRQLSQKVREFLELQIPQIEQFSIDEFFGDLAGYKKDSEALDFAKYLQAELLKRFSLPASIGINHSKWAAKLLTDLAKPFGVRLELDMRRAIKGVDISAFAGIGREIERYLRSYGVNTLDELLSRPELLAKYGKNGSKILARIQGIDGEPVAENKASKSHGISKSFKPIAETAELERRIRVLARYLSVWVNKNGYHPRRLEIALKSGSAHCHTALSLAQPFCEKDLLNKCCEGFYKLHKEAKNGAVYYLGLSVSALEKDYCENLFASSQKDKTLNDTLLKIRDKFGINCIKYGKL